MGTTASILTKDMTTQAILHTQRDKVVKNPLGIGKELKIICGNCKVMTAEAFPKITQIFTEIKEKYSTGSGESAHLGSLALDAVIEKGFRVVGSSQESRYKLLMDKIQATIKGLPVVETKAIDLEHSFSTAEFAKGVHEHLESLQFGPKDSEHNISLHNAEERLSILKDYITDQMSVASMTGLDIGKMFSVMSGQVQVDETGATIESPFKRLLKEQSLLEDIIRFKNTGDVKHFAKIMDKAGANPVILDSIIKEKPEHVPVIIGHYDEKAWDKTDLMLIIARDYQFSDSEASIETGYQSEEIHSGSEAEEVWTDYETDTEAS
ncbi:MAG: hypothetical protein S4CHLAM6_08890 [Chlamydiae bacterium]|nr:hypothetical protein [Chlamydiota bacterium]